MTRWRAPSSPCVHPQYGDRESSKAGLCSGPPIASWFVTPTKSSGWSSHNTFWRVVILSTTWFLAMSARFPSSRIAVYASGWRIACVASVSVVFGSKEYYSAKNRASKRGRRGRGRKEGNARRQTPGFWKLPTWPFMPERAHWDFVLSSAVIN